MMHLIQNLKNRRNTFLDSVTGEFCYFSFDHYKGGEIQNAHALLATLRSVEPGSLLTLAKCQMIMNAPST